MEKPSSQCFLGIYLVLDLIWNTDIQCAAAKAGGGGGGRERKRRRGRRHNLAMNLRLSDGIRRRPFNKVLNGVNTPKNANSVLNSEPRLHCAVSSNIFERYNLSSFTSGWSVKFGLAIKLDADTIKTHSGQMWEGISALWSSLPNLSTYHNLTILLFCSNIKRVFFFFKWHTTIELRIVAITKYSRFVWQSQYRYDTLKKKLPFPEQYKTTTQESFRQTA